MTSETPETPTVSKRGGYLPVLPDGWVYNINIIRTDSEAGDNIVVQPEGDHTGAPTGRSLIHVFSSAGRKSLSRDSLGEGIRAAVDSAKILDRLAKSEAEFIAARAAAMDSIGDGDDDGDGVPNGEETDAPHVVDPVAAGDLAKDAEADQ